MATFSLKGLALKLDSAADVQKHLPSTPSTDIETVILEGNTIGVDAAAELSNYLVTCSNLQVANLADIFTGRLLLEIPQALSSLLTALLKCEKLHTINLNDNAFGLNTVEPLRPFLSQAVPLRNLYLNNNGLGPQAGSLVAEALTALAEKKQREHGPPLETIICGRNRLEAGSMKAWSQAFQAHNKSLKVVKMVQNGIRPEGTAHLLQHGLSACTGLEVLDLQDNTFTVLAAKTLAGTIGKWTELRELGVGDSLLSARGGILLGDALRQGQNKKVEVLRLQYNDIDTRGLKSLVGAAGHLPRLRRVELNGNKFSEEDPSIEKLQEILSERKSAAYGSFTSAEKYEGIDEYDEEAWGLDELDELDDDEDEDEEADEVEDEEASITKDADAAEDEPVAQEKDKDVDALADALGKTELQ